MALVLVVLVLLFVFLADTKPPLLGCAEMKQRLKVGTFLGAGYTTMVYHGHLDGQHVVVKKFQNDTVHKFPMLEQYRVNSFKNRLAFARLQLEHPNLMKVFGVCESICPHHSHLQNLKKPENLHKQLIQVNMKST